MAGKARIDDEREELRERIESWTEVPLNLLGIVLLVALVTEFAADLSAAWRSRLDALNWFIYITFTANFLVQLGLAPDKLAYLRRNWIAAVSVLLPVFRVFRVLRAVRALRGLRLVRVLTATNRGTRSLSCILRGHQFDRVMGLTAAVVLVGAAALVYFEGRGAYGEALWWSMALVATLGSDFQPEMLEGRVVTLLLIVWVWGCSATSREPSPPTSSAGTPRPEPGRMGARIRPPRNCGVCALRWRSSKPYSPGQGLIERKIARKDYNSTAPG